MLLVIGPLYLEDHAHGYWQADVPAAFRQAHRYGAVCHVTPMEVQADGTLTLARDLSAHRSPYTSAATVAEAVRGLLAHLRTEAQITAHQLPLYRHPVLEAEAVAQREDMARRQGGMREEIIGR